MTDRKVVTVSLAPPVLERLDGYAKKRRMNRSQVLAVIINDFLDAEEAKPQMLQMMEGMGAMMSNLFTMSRAQITENMEKMEAQIQALPESVKEQISASK